MLLLKNLMIFSLIFLSGVLHSWEEDPRIAEHNNRTAYLLKLGDRQVQEGDEDVIYLLNLMHNERKKLSEKKDE